MPMITKHIRTLRECVGTPVSETRPMAKSSSHGELNPRPSLDLTSRIPRDTVRMGRGTDPHKVVEQDWADYRAFMNGYNL